MSTCISCSLASDTWCFDIISCLLFWASKVLMNAISLAWNDTENEYRVYCQHYANLLNFCIFSKIMKNFFDTTIFAANAQWDGLGRQWGGKKESMGWQNRSQWGGFTFQYLSCWLKIFSNKSKCKADKSLTKYKI